MILILEDDADRVRRFHSAASIITPDLPLRVWRSTHAMVDDLPECLEHATLITLDHDLTPWPHDADDPGTGYDVVQLLEQLIPCCPVIIHTSNAERGTWMEGGLSRAGWIYKRVLPVGDDWIETTWTHAAKRLLALSQPKPV